MPCADNVDMRMTRRDARLRAGITSRQYGLYDDDGDKMD